MRQKLIFLGLILLLAPMSWGDESLCIGTGTKFIFTSPEASGIPFSPCEGNDKRFSSCAVMEKEGSGGFSREKTKCTFKVENAKISRLNTPGGHRTLVVKTVKRSDDEKVELVTLSGAEHPVLLSCEKIHILATGRQMIPNMPLTEALLQGFNKVKLDNIVYDKPVKQVPVEPIPAASEEEKESGAAM